MMFENRQTVVWGLVNHLVSIVALIFQREQHRKIVAPGAALPRKSVVKKSQIENDEQD